MTKPKTAADDPSPVVAFDSNERFYKLCRKAERCQLVKVGGRNMDYQKQGEDFLKTHGLSFRATRTERNACPLWDTPDHTHGDEYQITIWRPGQSGRLSFRFWNSLNDMQTGQEPTAYDVLTCVSSDSHTPETFEDFCSEYGYDQDSRKAEKVFKAADKLGRRIRAFFSEDELEALREIQ